MNFQINAGLQGPMAGTPTFNSYGLGPAYKKTAFQQWGKEAILDLAQSDDDRVSRLRGYLIEGWEGIGDFTSPEQLGENWVRLRSGPGTYGYALADKDMSISQTLMFDTRDGSVKLATRKRLDDKHSSSETLTWHREPRKLGNTEFPNITRKSQFHGPKRELPDLPPIVARPTVCGAKFDGEFSGVV